MNIAIITPKMIIGGAETYILTKAIHFCSEGNTVVVVSEGGENVKNLPTGATHIALPVDATPYHLSKQQFNTIIDQLAQIFIAHRIDVVEAHNTYPILYASLACRKAHIPCLYNVLNELSHRKQLVTNILVKCFSKAGCYFTLTQQMNHYIEQQLRTTLCPVIIPIPVAAISNPDDNRSENYILSVCRFSSDKMYVLSLIEGFGNAIGKGDIAQGFVLKIVGDGDLLCEVKKKAEQVNQQIGRDAVEILGTKVDAELDDLFRHCNVYVGMGTTILIAAQYRKPVIKVGFETHTMTSAWGYWGEDKNDAQCLVAETKQKEPTPFADMLKIVNFDDKLQFWGNEANKTYHLNYQFETIMTCWYDEYKRIQVQNYILSQEVINLIKCKLYVLRIVKKLQRIIMR